MKSNKIVKIESNKMFLIFAFVFLSVLIGACSSNMSIDQKPGALLWGENCGRCHNVRPPSSLTDTQWELAVLHMRTRANLTEVETDKIIQFLKAAN